MRTNRKPPLATASDNSQSPKTAKAVTLEGLLYEIREVKLFLRDLRRILDGDTETQVQELVDHYGGPDNPILAAWYDS